MTSTQQAGPRYPIRFSQKAYVHWLEETLPNPEAREIFSQMGQGMRLGVSRTILEDTRLFKDKVGPWNPPFEEREVSHLAVSQLVDSGLVSELTEYEENHRIGWREKGLPGDAYKIYACRQ